VEGVAAVDFKNSVGPPTSANTVVRAALPEVQTEILSHIEQYRQQSSSHDRWQVEILLRPPELGSIRLQLQMQGAELLGRLDFENAKLQEFVERLVPELEQQLKNEQGGGAFSWFRGSQQEGQADPRGPGSHEQESRGDRRREPAREETQRPGTDEEGVDRQVDILA
jgi:flagellar hook-length control protein FliK